jgi:hypothetical protein
MHTTPDNLNIDHSNKILFNTNAKFPPEESPTSTTLEIFTLKSWEKQKIPHTVA